MKNLNLLDKLIFLINSLVAFLLLLAYILPLVPPKQFAALAVLSLGLPFLVLINVLFTLYWVIKLKRQFILSGIIVTLGYFLFGSLYKFSKDDTETTPTNELSVMSYNVRLFNVYNWIKDTDLPAKMSSFIKEENPDILCLQEYRFGTKVSLKEYPYKYVKTNGKKSKNGQAIFSKYPIIKSGSIQFPKTGNNAVYVDVVFKTDTLRVYNIHLQSLKLERNKLNNLTEVTQEQSKTLFNGIGRTFKRQQQQTELVSKHKLNSPYKMIITGDFNNTAFSYVYRAIKGDLTDAFNSAGNGFGKTYNFKFFPLRIDYVLGDASFTVKDFKTYDTINYSDHYPVKAVFGL